MTRPVGRPRGSSTSGLRRNDLSTATPPDIHERIRWKRMELQKWLLQREERPGDLVVRGVVSRLADELGAMEAFRDNRPWRRNG